MKRYKDTNLKVTKDGRVFGPRGERSTNPKKSGYVQVSMSKNGKRNDFYVHRMVAELYIPNPNNKPEVNHKDGNKANNHVFNLEWATREEQMQHAKQTGLMPDRNGQNNGQSKITDKDRQTIHYLKSLGWLQKEIAEEFGIDRSRVSHILSQKYWSKYE